MSETRLLTIWIAAASITVTSSEQMIECILDELSVFAKDQQQRDDMTLLVMDVQEGCEA